MRFIPAVSPVQIQVPLPDPKRRHRAVFWDFPSGVSRPAWATWPVGQVVKTPPFHGGIPGSIPGRVTTWTISSAGRAPALQAGCRQFDPVIVHQKKDYHKIVLFVFPFYRGAYIIIYTPIRQIMLPIMSYISGRIPSINHPQRMERMMNIPP